MNGAVTDAEILATTLPGAPWNGWYCKNHPRGEALANDRTRDVCWGCGNFKPIEKEEPSMDEFKPGDLVKLKSGGPAMTVESVDRKEGGFVCLWFTDGELDSDTFVSAVLVMISPEDIPMTAAEKNEALLKMHENAAAAAPIRALENA